MTTEVLTDAGARRTADLGAPTDGPARATVAVKGIGAVMLWAEAAGAKGQCRVSAKICDVRHHDRLDVSSAARRRQFLAALADKAGVSPDALYADLDARLVELGDAAAANAATAAKKAHTSDDAPQSQATTIAGLAAGWELWHTPAGDAYATIIVNGHRENWPVRSQTFRRLVAKSFYETTGKAANTESISAASNLIEAQAAHNGPEFPVFVRVAEDFGNVYVDLTDAEWRAVEITAAGWSIVDEPPVRFRRTKGMRPLPPPERGGRVVDLRRFINVDDADWPLVVAWLVGAFRPTGPYPVLALFATQGAGKSHTCKVLRSLVDPNGAPLRAEPKDAHDLMISTDGSWVIAYDNLSHLPGWLSDALCRLSTGGGFATRELYTNADEVIFDAMRPAILTSIVELAERSDLLDRCLPVSLPPIGDDRRRTEKVLRAEFEAARPKILGALFDAVAGALRDLPGVSQKWIDAAKHDAAEQARRQESDFLAVANHDGEVFDFHALRHTTGAWLAMAGCHPKSIQSVMRHSTITLTMDTYGHLFPGQEAETIARLPSMLTTTATMQATAADDSASCAQRQAQRAGSEAMQRHATACKRELAGGVADDSAKSLCLTEFCEGMPADATASPDYSWLRE